MNLTAELRKISDKTANRLKREKEKTRATVSRNQKEEYQKEAEQILKELPAELKNSAKNSANRKYEVMNMPDVSMPHDRKFNPRDLRGVERIVFVGCKKLGLDVRVGHSEYDDGMTGVPCAGIWVHW